MKSLITEKFTFDLTESDEYQHGRIGDEETSWAVRHSGYADRVGKTDGYQCVHNGGRWREMIRMRDTRIRSTLLEDSYLGVSLP